MNEPRVLCIMLACGREAMVQRALKSFRAQTYENKALLVVNSGPGPLLMRETANEIEPCFIGIDRLSVGELRNHACKYGATHYTVSWHRPEIFVHWDSDDWSHPARLGEQVALLQETRAGVVGYSEMLFYDTTSMTQPKGSRARHDCGQAWLYSSPNPKTMLGTSLCYWRDAWERVPFRGVSAGEDTLWALDLASQRVKTAACSAMTMSATLIVEAINSGVKPATVYTSRMIATIHGDNTTSRIQPGAVEWKRVAQYDAWCRETMKLC